MPRSTAEFEIVGSVAPEEIPEDARHRHLASPMRDLATRILDDHANGRVTVIRVKNIDELRRLRNSLSSYMRASQLSLRPVSSRVNTPTGTELRVFLEVRPLQDLRRNGSATP